MGIVSRADPAGLEMVTSTTDRAYQTFYRVAFAAAQLWWFVRRPSHTGALAAAWSGGRVLLVRQSYQPLWTLPGGGVSAGEDPAGAAARELAEEIGLAVAPDRLLPGGVYEHVYRWRHDRVHIFEMNLDSQVELTPDRREIVELRWSSPDEAAGLAIVPHLRSYLRDRTSSQFAGTVS